MAFCLIHEASVSFKAYIRVVATPGSQVWATHNSTGRIFYPKNEAVADSSGVAIIPVKKKGGYMVTSDATGTQTVEVSITRARQTVAANVTGAFTLDISAYTVNSTAFATISVTRTSSPFADAGTGALANGAAVYYGDVLSATASPTTGFENASVVSGGDISGSAGIYTVEGDCSLQGTASPKAFTITRTSKTINSKTAATVAVERVSSPFKGETAGTLSGNTVYHGDTLRFTSSNQNTSAYAVSAPTISGASASNGIYTVNNADITATANASVNSWTLTVTAGANVTVTVSRSSSPYQGAGTGSIASKKNGSATATIYYGDVLSASYSADAGYGYSSSTSGTLNGVNKAVSVSATSAILPYYPSNMTNYWIGQRSYNGNDWIYNSENNVGSSSKMGWIRTDSSGNYNKMTVYGKIGDTTGSQYVGYAQKLTSSRMRLTNGQTITVRWTVDDWGTNPAKCTAVVCVLYGTNTPEAGKKSPEKNLTYIGNSSGINISNGSGSYTFTGTTGDYYLSVAMKADPISYNESTMNAGTIIITSITIS